MSKVKTALFSVGIAVVLALFLNVAFSLFYERPDWPSTACTPLYKPDGTQQNYDQSACDAAQAAYQKESDSYNFKLFIFSLVTGVGLLIAGLLIANSAIAWGAMFAGIFQLVFGAANYWSQLNKFWKFGLLGLALVFLIMIAKKYVDK